MTLRKFFNLFWKTTLYGTLVGGVVGLIILVAFPGYAWLEGMQTGFNLLNVFLVLVSGAMVGVFSQMGFFSYLIVRYIVLAMIRKNLYWEIIQVFLVVVVLFDAIYLRYSLFKGEEPVLYTILMPIILLVISLLVSVQKVKLTRKSAFVPTLFFMFVVTILEAMPAIRVASIPSQLLVLSVLIVCNAYQILVLHKILGNESSSKEAAPLQA